MYYYKLDIKLREWIQNKKNNIKHLNDIVSLNFKCFESDKNIESPFVNPRGTVKVYTTCVAYEIGD